VPGAGALAAQLVQAPTFAVTLVTELQSEVAGVEVPAPRAVVVDPVAVGEQRSALVVGGRQLLEGQVVHQCRGDVVDVRRAAGQVDDRHALDHVGHPHRAGGVRRSRRQATVRGAGAHVDDGDRSFGCLREALDGGPAADHAVGTGCPQRDRPLDHHDVTAVGQRPGERFLGLGSRRGHDRLVVVHGDDVEDEVADARAAGSKERLGVPRAVLELQPHQRGLACGLHGVGDLGRQHRRQGHDGSDPGGPAEQGPAAHACGRQAFAERSGLGGK
jgi:hypothetical protein